MTRPGTRNTSRHLRWDLFESLIGRGPPSIEPLRGKPAIEFFVEPHGRRIGLRIHTPVAQLPISTLADVSIAGLVRGTASVVEIATSREALFRDFYALGCSISDRIQLDGLPAEQAIETTLAAWRDLLRQRRALSPNAQIGLIGELHFFLHLTRSHPVTEVLGAWQGPRGEEHDFALEALDVEVKTTTGERRRHHISSLTQLSPKQGRPLAVLSIQITRGGISGGNFSLASLVGQCLATCRGSDLVVARDYLERLGWKDEDAALYQERYRLRTPMCIIPVDKNFPAIVPETLVGLGPTIATRINQIEYWVDLDGLGTTEDKRTFARLTRLG